MTEFTIHTPQTAPEGSRDVLEQFQKKNGFVPNFLAMLAESPAALKAYLQLSELMGQTAFTETERQVLFLAVSALNGCDYCVSAHSTLAAMNKVEAEVITALRDGEPIDDPKLEELRRFAEEMVEKRGWVSEERVQQFLNAGYSKEQLLEVILALSMKTLSNYANHQFDTPLDSAFEKTRWEKQTTPQT